jgi:hypothetical protein
MFYIIVQIKGTPIVVNNSLHFGKDAIFDYYVTGCTTPKVRNSYNSEWTTEWSAYNQRYKPEDFIKQVQKFSQNKDFEFLCRSFN